MSSQSSQRSGTHGNTFETTCDTSFAKKCSSHQRSRLVLPQIRIRRDPKLFMQEAPVLASRMEMRSNAASPGPRLLPDCNTGRSPRSYAVPDESTIIDARYVECFTLVDMCCCSALHSAAILMQVIVADSTFECSQAGLDGRPRLPLPPRGDWEHRTAP
jgi:hypothetical protein